MKFNRKSLQASVLPRERDQISVPGLVVILSSIGGAENAA